MRIFFIFLLLLFSTFNLYAVDFTGRTPNDKLDSDIYNDFEIAKSGYYYLTAMGGFKSFTYIADTPEYIAGITFGGNFSKYFGSELVIAKEDFLYQSAGVPPEYLSTYNASGYITFRYAFRYNYALSIIPYAGVGINMGLYSVPGNSVLLPLDERLSNDFNGITRSYIPSFGFSVKAGLRFKVMRALLGLGVIYNFTYLDFNMKAPNYFLEVGVTF